MEPSQHPKLYACSCDGEDFFFSSVSSCSYFYSFSNMHCTLVFLSWSAAVWSAPAWRLSTEMNVKDESFDTGECLRCSGMLRRMCFL